MRTRAIRSLFGIRWRIQLRSLWRIWCRFLIRLPGRRSRIGLSRGRRGVMTATAIGAILLVMGSVASDQCRDRDSYRKSSELLTSLSEHHCFPCSLNLDLTHPFVPEPYSYQSRLRPSDRSVVIAAVRTVDYILRIPTLRSRRTTDINLSSCDEGNAAKRGHSQNDHLGRSRQEGHRSLSVCVSPDGRIAAGIHIF